MESILPELGVHLMFGQWIQEGKARKWPPLQTPKNNDIQHYSSVLIPPSSVSDLQRETENSFKLISGREQNLPEMVLNVIVCGELQDPVV